MSNNSSIEWTESTWNPITGCNKVSEGCRNCYAERMAYRLKAMGQKNYQKGFTLQLHHDVLEKPLHWKKPQVIFVNSMSDMFHPDVPLSFINKMFDVMRKADWHTFQILTKRAERLRRLDSQITWPSNAWMGVSVENWEVVDRIDFLRETNAAVKFLSLEPLISPLPNLNLKGIDWVIVGGESGPGARPMKEEWVWDIKVQCNNAKIPFFFKQWGGVNKKKTGRILRGNTYNELPLISL
ncbi:phage Gp37/Gp68 family protein [bacterium]|nr:phage Gp37/Gp68 family protein [bacterium]